MRKPGTPTALAVAQPRAGIAVKSSGDPHMAVADMTPQDADGLRRTFGDTHFVEPNVRGGLT